MDGVTLFIDHGPGHTASLTSLRCLWLLIPRLGRLGIYKYLLLRQPGVSSWRGSCHLDPLDRGPSAEWVRVQINKATVNMLRRVEPYITWGTPNLKTVKELIYKRGYGKVGGGQRCCVSAWMTKIRAVAEQCLQRDCF